MWEARAKRPSERGDLELDAAEGLENQHNVDQDGDDDQGGDWPLAVVADVVRDSAADRGRQVVENGVVWLLLADRAMQEQHDKAAEDGHRYPVIDRFQANTLPSFRPTIPRARCMVAATCEARLTVLARPRA